MSVLQHTVIPSSPVHGTFRQHCASSLLGSIIASCIESVGQHHASSLLGSIVHRVCWAASCIESVGQHHALSLLGSIMHRVCWAASCIMHRVCWAASCIVEPHLFTKLLGSIVHEALVFGGQLRGPHGLLTHQVHLQTQCTDMWHQHVSTPHTTYTCKHNAQTCGINVAVLQKPNTHANTMHRHMASMCQYSMYHSHLKYTVQNRIRLLSA